MGFNALLGMLGVTLLMFLLVGVVGYILFRDTE